QHNHEHTADQPYPNCNTNETCRLPAEIGRRGVDRLRRLTDTAEFVACAGGPYLRQHRSTLDHRSGQDTRCIVPTEMHVGLCAALKYAFANPDRLARQQRFIGMELRGSTGLAVAAIAHSATGPGPSMMPNGGGMTGEPSGMMGLYGNASGYLDGL